MSLDTALEAEAAAIAARYRIHKDAAMVTLRDALQDRKLAAAVEAEVARGNARGAAMRRLAKEARRRVYHDLRRYTADVDEQEALRDELAAAVDEAAVRGVVGQLLATHVSTRERLPSLEAFFDTVAQLAGEARSAVDLGAGLHPLASLPRSPAIDVYVAIDRDARAVEILRAYAEWARPARLLALQADLEGLNWDDVAAAAGIDEFDHAYLLKLVPVLQRQQPSALEVVARVPARTLVITGSKEALTRRHDISRREDRVIQRFLEAVQPASVHRTETLDEIVYVARR